MHLLHNSMHVIVHGRLVDVACGLASGQTMEISVISFLEGGTGGCVSLHVIGLTTMFL